MYLSQSPAARRSSLAGVVGVPMGSAAAPGPCTDGTQALAALGRVTELLSLPCSVTPLAQPAGHAMKFESRAPSPSLLVADLALRHWALHTYSEALSWAATLISCNPIAVLLPWPSLSRRYQAESSLATQAQQFPLASFYHATGAWQVDLPGVYIISEPVCRYV